MRELGITTGQYCDVSDSELYSIITTLVRNLPNSGITMICRHLRSWATVKAGTQERGTKCGMEVRWFHTGNYTEMMQVMINGSFPVTS